MKDKLFLGLDLGGTGVKAALFDRRGRLQDLARRPLEPVPVGGQGAEIPMEEIEEAARAAVREVTQGGRRPVAALSVASQGETFVALDAADRPLHPAILWYDSRAAEQADALLRMLAPPRGTKPAPLQINEIATAAKIHWLREHRPAVFRRAARYLLLPEYLAYRLTGRAVTDPSTALSTGLYADGADTWHAPALAATGLQAGQLAVIRKTATPVGPVLPRAARAWGLAPDTLFVTGTNDQYAGAMGAGNSRPGIVSVTLGTCLAAVTLVRRQPRPLPSGMIVGRFPIEPYDYALAYAKTSGLLLDWFVREFAPDLDRGALERQAARVPIGADGLTINPHFQGRVSPVPDPSARGVVTGLTLRHGRAAFYRALLEGLTFVLHENLLAWRAQGLRPRVIRAIGGGAASDFWLQMQADVTGLTVERPAVPEAAVLGAALIAAVGSGAMPSLQAGSRTWYRPHRLFRPQRQNRQAYGAAFTRSFV